jgi:cellulose synthase/poly-beta-1,6-N-acetylglucosamine synthase-like glycosyltransferase
LQGIEYAKSIGVGRRVAAFFGILRIISGAFGAFRKDILDRIGGWDVGPGLDGDITFKHRKLGYKIAYEPDAVCLTHSPATFKKLAKQRYRWDRSLIRFRLRKHRNLLFPDANFTFRNFFSTMDNILYNLILNINWWIYYIYLFSEHYHLLGYLLPMNYFLYVISNLIQFSVYLAVTRNKEMRKRQFRLFLYMPLMPLYTGGFLRIVRTWAYIMEFFFKKSYEDSWNPWKVSKAAKEKGL